MKVINNTVYFWNHREVFSNHYKSNITVAGKKFNCAEQYFMYKKALIFKDYDIAEKILQENNPNNHKKLGRQIKAFNQVVWDENKYNIMYEACKLKFDTEPLTKFLTKYKGYKFVEASPYDRVWGVGLSEDDPRVLDKSQWQGENLLGEILTDIFSHGGI